MTGAMERRLSQPASTAWARLLRVHSGPWVCPWTNHSRRRHAERWAGRVSQKKTINPKISTLPSSDFHVCLGTLGIRECVKQKVLTSSPMPPWGFWGCWMCGGSISSDEDLSCERRFDEDLSCERRLDEDLSCERRFDEGWLGEGWSIKP